MLNNKLSHKRIEVYEIIGTPNTEGVIVERFSETQHYNQLFDYFVSLLSIECGSYFPNIIKGKNNLLKISIDAHHTERTIEFETGAYEIEDINNHIQDVVPNELIKIEIDKGTGKSKIKLKPTVKIHFDIENSIRSILGYNTDIVLDKELNISPNMCNVMNTQKIFIYLDIVKGSWFKGQPSSILYSFSNEVQYGMPITIKPKHKQECLLLNHQFNELRIRFTNEKNEAINFMSTPVSITLEVKQV
jgi:hypothetical protein